MLNAKFIMQHQPALYPASNICELMYHIYHHLGRGAHVELCGFIASGKSIDYMAWEESHSTMQGLKGSRILYIV